MFKKFISTLKNNKNIINELNNFLESPKYINFFNPENDNELRFQKLKNILVSHNNISKFQILINSFYKFHKVSPNIATKIDAKKLMSAWMIVGFPEFVLGKSKVNISNENIYPDDIYLIACKMITNLNYLIEHKSNYNDEHVRMFLKSMNQYSNALYYFINRDKLEQLEKLILEYSDINATSNLILNCNNYTDDVKEESVNVLNNTKDMIFKYIQKLDKNITKENLELFSSLSLLKEQKIEEVQYNILLEDIRSKQLFFLKKVIDEIKVNLVKLGSEKTTNGYNLNEIIDSDFIIRLIAYKKILTGDDINNYGDYLIKIINELQAPISVNDTNDKWNILKNNNIDPDEHLAKMLFMILLEIKTIKETIINLDTASKIGIDILDFHAK